MTCDRLENEDLLADLGGSLDAHVEHCPDCRARLRGYRQIAGLIASGETSYRAPADWKQRTLARMYAAPRSRRRRIATLAAMAGAVAAGLAVLLWLSPPEPSDGHHVPPPSTPGLTMQIVDGGGWRGEAHPGEEVRAHARVIGSAYFEIRVYRGARDLLVRCPHAGPSACRDPDGSMLVWTVPSVGTYQVVLLASSRPIAAPRGSLDDDVSAATAAGARAVDVETIHVH